jgi:hypothetical protein
LSSAVVGEPEVKGSRVLTFLEDTSVPRVEEHDLAHRPGRDGPNPDDPAHGLIISGAKQKRVGRLGDCPHCPSIEIQKDACLHSDVTAVVRKENPSSQFKDPNLALNLDRFSHFSSLEIVDSHPGRMAFEEPPRLGDENALPPTDDPHAFRHRYRLIPTTSLLGIMMNDSKWIERQRSATDEDHGPVSDIWLTLGRR